MTVAPTAPDTDSRTAMEMAAELEQRFGRRVRILHIGNIANNAYLNARILNDAGFDCDVLCHDYYHIMGCPEWEDAEIVGEIGDHFAPDWRTVDLGGFRRPAWFAQGPFRLATDYLIARRSGEERRARLLRAQLAAVKPGGTQPALWRRALRRASHRIAAPFAAMCNVLRLGALATFVALLRQLHPIQFVRLAISLRVLVGRMVCGLTRAVWNLTTIVLATTRLGRLLPKRWRQWWWDSKSELDCHERDLQRALDRRPALPDLKPIATAAARPARRRPADDLVERFAGRFPDREDQLVAADLTPYSCTLAQWHDLLDQYDLVIGYATDGLHPLMCGKRPYFAFEHGTIRSIPFEETAQGRLCALTYAEANHCFITNCDNITAAERLGLEHFGFLPHPVNESFTEEGDVGPLRQSLCDELDADFLVFHPARQHWEPGIRHPSWEKGNDHLIRGFAAFIASTGARGGAVFVDWGQTVDASKALLAELGVADRVKWIDPLPNRTMIRWVRACDVVADQFHLGAFGSLTPKALMCEKPCLLYLDEERHRWCFPELPPIVNASRPDEVEAALTRIHGDADWRDSLAQEGRAWYLRYHSNEIIGRTMAGVAERELRDYGTI